MRIPIALAAAAALAPVLFLTGCGGVNGAPANKPASISVPISAGSAAKPAPDATSAPVTSAANHVAPVSSAKPIAPITTNHVPTAPAPAPAQPITTDPRPASPVSHGLVPVTTWKGTPAAKSVYVDDQKIISYAPDGHVLGHWDLPGNLPAIIAGLTTAFGHSPLARVNSTYGWTYTWDGFVIRDNTPEVAGPTDPPYQWDVTVSNVDGVAVNTVHNISVGTSGDAAAAIADWSGLPGVFVAEIAPVALSVPTSGDPRLWVEVTGGATQHAPITELRGPVGSWLS